MARSLFSFSKLSSALLCIAVLGGCNLPSENSAPNLKKLTLDSNGIVPATIYSNGDVDNELMIHAADILAGYLDNDGDGNWDNEQVVTRLSNSNAAVILLDDELDIEEWLLSLPASLQDELLDTEFVDLRVSDVSLCNHSSYEECSFGYGRTFDATYEEVLHLITTLGYAEEYPDVFAENETSEIAQAMNIARSDADGELNNANYCSDIDDEPECNWPHLYHEPVWFSYIDPTCDYACQVSEYTYWNITSLLGIQNNRSISGSEWDCLYLSRFSNANHECSNELKPQGSVATLYGPNATVSDGVFDPGGNPYMLPTSIPFGGYQVNSQPVSWDIEYL